MGGCCNGATEQELKAYQKMMEEKQLDGKAFKPGSMRPMGNRPAFDANRDLTTDYVDEQ